MKRELSGHAKAVIYAYNKGYRVKDDGTFTGPDGNSICTPTDNVGYYFKSLYEGSRLTNNRILHLLVIHRLAAYQKFGDAIFAKGIEVRHLNGIGTDNRLENIEIGTGSQNQMDIPKSKRMARADKIRIPMQMVVVIGEDVDAGMGVAKMCEKYNLTKCTITNLIRKYRREFSLTKPFVRSCGRKCEDEDVRKIRKLYGSMKYTKTKIAEIYGISRTSVTKIVNKTRYRDVV